MIHGQEYVSNARLIQPGKTYPKVYCVPPTSIGKRMSDKIVEAIVSTNRRSH
jgi:hypothetical protein